MSVLIKNADIINRDDILENQDVVINGQQLKQVGGKYEQTGTADTIIDGTGLYASAGFIDIHTHGAGGADYMDATTSAYQTAGIMSAWHGATTVIPTTLSATVEELFETFAVFEEFSGISYNGADMPGLHLEGPYFSKEPVYRGAQDPKYVRDPEAAEYLYVLENGKNILRWSVACELPGALEFGSCLTERGILPAIAHSNAPLNNVIEAFNRGFRLVTHMYCCTSILCHDGKWRPGIVEGAYILDDMYAECIGDGIHVSPELLDVCYRIKGADRVVLCTDSMRAAGTDVEKSILGSLKNGRECYFEGGVAKITGTDITAASVATANRMLKTAAIDAKIPLPDAVKMLTSSPADIMGLRDRGRLIPGLRADVVLFDRNMDVRTVIVGGKIVRDDKK